MNIGQKTKHTIHKTPISAKLKATTRLLTSLLLGLTIVSVLLIGIDAKRVTLAQEEYPGISTDSLTLQPVLVATIPLPVSSPLIQAATAVNSTTGYTYVLARTLSPYSNANLMIISGTEVVANYTSADYGSALAVNPNLGRVYLPVVGGVTVISGTEIVGSIPIDMTLVGATTGVEPNSDYIYVDGYDHFTTCIPETPQCGGIVWVLANEETTRLNVGGRVATIGVNSVTGYTYATVRAGSLFNPRYTKVIQGAEEAAEIQSFGETIAVNLDNGYVYIAEADQNRVHVLSGTQVLQTVATGAEPRAVGVNSRTGYVYVANTGSNSVTVISATQVITSLVVGLAPESIGVNPESGYIYVANAGSDTLSVISGTQIIWTLPTGQSPKTIDVSPDTGYIYVVNYDDATISVIREMILPYRGYLPFIVKD